MLPSPRRARHHHLRDRRRKYEDQSHMKMATASPDDRKCRCLTIIGVREKAEKFIEQQERMEENC